MVKVKSINIYNFRSFEKVENLELSEINVLIGENNSGKSSILRALQHLQQGLVNIYEDVRVGSPHAEIQIHIENANTQHYWREGLGADVFFNCAIESSDRQNGKCHHRLKGNGREFKETNNILFPNTEPNHFIIPFLSRRKASHYQEEVKKKQASQVAFDTSNLAAKLSIIGNVSFPKHKSYIDACTEILGFPITAVVTENGQRPGVHLDDGATIFIDQMGEGVPNIVLLLVNLALSKNKLFLIEEPENDLHPHALKALLNLIKESSKHNQFVISTHSNIVVTHMCSESNSKLFKITSEKGKLPTKAKVEEIDNIPSERIAVLQELGYSFADHHLWDGWLLLEESSAERIIKDYLIPWFVPKLRGLKTISAGGASKIEPTFTDLHRLMLFTHLQPAYIGKSWVIADGDTTGQETIEQMRNKFKSIEPTKFSVFSKEQFEYYYPEFFKRNIENALSIKDKKERMQAKNQLIVDVTKWLDQDTAQVKSALETSANEVILKLKEIESILYPAKETQEIIA